MNMAMNPDGPLGEGRHTPINPGAYRWGPYVGVRREYHHDCRGAGSPPLPLSDLRTFGLRADGHRDLVFACRVTTARGWPDIRTSSRMRSQLHRPSPDTRNARSARLPESP